MDDVFSSKATFSQWLKARKITFWQAMDEVAESILDHQLRNLFMLAVEDMRKSYGRGD